MKPNILIPRRGEVWLYKGTPVYIVECYCNEAELSKSVVYFKFVTSFNAKRHRLSPTGSDHLGDKGAFSCKVPGAKVLITVVLPRRLRKKHGRVRKVLQEERHKKKKEKDTLEIMKDRVFKPEY